MRSGYGAADHQYHIGSTFVDPRGVGVYGNDKPKSEPTVEFLMEPLGIRNPADVLSRVALVEELARYRIASRSPGEATELGQWRPGPLGTMGTRAYPQALCTSTRRGSEDASVGQVQPLPPVTANRVEWQDRLFQTADAPESTRSESPAATSTLLAGHHLFGRASNWPSCIQVSASPTWTPALPGYCNQHTLGS